MKKKSLILFCLFLIVISMAACTNARQMTDDNHLSESESESLGEEHPFKIVDTMQLDYASLFQIDDLEGGYTLLTLSDNKSYLIVPKGASIPEGVSSDVIVIRQPVRQIYLAASAVMDMFIASDALDAISLSSLKEDAWYLEPAREAMENGAILFAGKYSMPDYELILDNGCQLSVLNTMIFHTPEVYEKLESLGIPVLIDRSSYEKHPLGRVEWVKVYGLLTGHEEQANQSYEQQKRQFEDVLQTVKKEQAEGKETKSVAFFYVNSQGLVSVRKGTDYVARMIDLAGGDYVFKDLGQNGNASSSENLQMEEFYARAKEADYLIYNSTIGGEIQNIDDLLDKSELFANFKAVKDGHVYCTERDMYQSSMEIGTMVKDIHTMLSEGNSDAKFSYLFKIQ